MKKFILLVIIVTLIGIAIYYLKLRKKNDNAISYQTEVVKRHDIVSIVEATGTIKAQIGAEVKVGTRISGKVQKLYANIGDQVNKGQIIAEIEHEDLSTKVSEAIINLKKAEANLELSKKNYERMKNLYTQDLIARNQVDIAERDFKVAQADLNEIRETIRYQQTQLSYATIVAPISGIIASVTTQEGETVSASSMNVPTFVTIVDLERLEINAYVDETDIGRIKKGLDVKFTVDSFPDTEFNGKVYAIYPKGTIQDNVVYYITVISIENTEGKLKPDMTTNVTILLNKRENVVAVPNRAIKRQHGKKMVYLLENGKSIGRTIETGSRDSYYTEVIKGISENDRVIIGEVNPTKNE